MVSIAAKIGCKAETLRLWVRQAQRDQGQRPGTTTDERERIKALEREVRELRQANGSVVRRALPVTATRSAVSTPTYWPGTPRGAALRRRSRVRAISMSKI